MIHDHREDTLTPRLREIVDFESALPALFAAVQSHDPQTGQLVRHALRQVHHYHCPIGIKVAENTWAFVVGEKLPSPNTWRSNWRVATSVREKWEKLLKVCVLKAVGVASWEHLKHLKRAPDCSVVMGLKVIRYVASTREFISDDDNLGSARKPPTDALKRLGLLREDRREWLKAQLTTQDEAPNGRALTVFFLWPIDVPQPPLPKE